MSSGGGPSSGGDRYLLDVLDPPDFAQSALGGAVQGFIRRGANPSSTPSGHVFETVSGFASGVTRKLGMIWAEASSLAATIKSQATIRYNFPLGHDLTLPSQSSGPGYWPLRYRMSTMVYRLTTPLVANCPLSFGLEWNGGVRRSLADPGASPPGYELVSLSTVNAGRWTVRYRLANGGALVVLQDTGITPDAAGPQHLEIRFDYVWPTPRLSCRVNGAEFGVLSGLAAIPAGNANAAQAVGLGQGLSVGGGAAQVDLRRAGRFRVEMLPGFPEL